MEGNKYERLGQTEFTTEDLRNLGDNTKSLFNCFFTVRINQAAGGW